MNIFEVEDQGWWNEEGTVFTWPIRMGEWGARVECHGPTPESAKTLAELVAQAVNWTMVIPTNA